MSGCGNDDSYSCKISSRTAFDLLVQRMQGFTAADSSAYFNDMTLLAEEPQIGEYIQLKKLEMFLDNMDSLLRGGMELMGGESMQEIMETYMVD